MNYIGLSHKQLSRFSHHWFWGICVDEKHGENLNDAAFRLQQHPELRIAMEKAVERVNQRHWLINSLYWLINYNQYRLHYYQLQGYWSLQLYKKVENMSIETMMQNFGPAEAGGLVVFSVASALAIKYLSPSVLLSLEWFSNKVLPYIPKENIKMVSVMLDDKLSCASASPMICVYSPPKQNANSPINPNLSDSFIVRANMLGMLKILAIDSKVGEWVLFDTIKTAYKAACLKTHPDKTGTQSYTEFLEVSNAYNQLLESIQDDLSLQTNLSKSGLSFFGEVDVINKRFADLREEQERLRKEMEQLTDDFKSISVIANRQNEEIVSQQKRIDALMTRNLLENEVRPGF